MLLDLIESADHVRRALQLIKHGNRRTQRDQFLHRNLPQRATRRRHVAHLLQAVKAKIRLDRLQVTGQLPRIGHRQVCRHASEAGRSVACQFLGRRDFAQDACGLLRENLLPRGALLRPLRRP